MKIVQDVLAISKVTRSDLVTKVATLRGAMLADTSVRFIYDGKERIVDVHAIGLSTKDDGLLLRGVQVDGTASRPLPSWNLFRVEGIEGLGLTFRKSEAPHEGFTAGDRQMNKVLIALDIG